MKQVLLIILLVSLKSFSQSILLGEINSIKNTSVDSINNELFVFYSDDSLSIIDLIGLKEKSKTKISYPQNDFNLEFPTVSIDSQIYFLDPSGGLVFRLKDDEISRIDNSFGHRMQINSTIFIFRDTIYRYGGYGFWSHRNFFTYYNNESKDWKIISPTGSKTLPKGSQNSIVNIVEDNIYVYGGVSLEEIKPLDFFDNNEVWKFNKTKRSWKKVGEFEFNLSDFKYNIPFKDDDIFINANDGVYLVDIENNLLKKYQKTTVQKKFVSSLNSFYLNGVFYCFVRDVDIKNDIRLISIKNEDFFGNLIEEGSFYHNNEKLYYTLGILILILLSIPIYLKGKKEIRNRNKIKLEKGNLIFKRRILPFDANRISIITLLLTSTKDVSLSDIMNVYEKKELNYGHNTRVINEIIEEINFKLKSILGIKEDLIISKKSGMDKRIKVYSIEKSFFTLK